MFQKKRLEKLSDNYETPECYFKQIIPFIQKDKMIWMPFYCSGRCKKIMEKLLKDNNLNNKVYHEKEDFFEKIKDTDFITNIQIIDNPPYSIKNKILKKVIEKDIPFMLLFPTNTIGLIFTQRIIKNKIQIIISPDYKGFIIDGKTTRAPPTTLIWICYKFNLDKDIIFL